MRSRNSTADAVTTASGPVAAGPDSADGFPVGWAAALVAFAAVAAFSNSFAGQFVMDDVVEIGENRSLDRLWPPFEAMFIGSLLPPRPLPYLTFAIDRAVWGAAPFGHHVTNLLIHVTAALVLFDLARRTLLSPRLAPACGRHAVGLALAIAVVWAVHPLQTQAVTYVYQRIESLTGLLCLVSLDAFAIAAFGGWGRGWLALSAVAALAAACSKETAAVLPPLMLAYDWTFVAREPRDVRGRWRWYAGLAGIWLVVAAQIYLQRQLYSEFRRPLHGGPIGYALTQPGVILHYLRLAVWPVGQCFDHEWPQARAVGEIVPPLLVVGAAVAATVIGLVRRRPWAWLGAAFFLLLAPTSSVMPVIAAAAEHRMYLPLAAVVAAAVLGGHAILAAWFDRGRSPGGRPLWPTLAAVTVAAVSLALGIATQRRNELYHDRVALWRDVLARAPHNFRAHTWLMSFAANRGDFDEAVREAEEAVRCKADCDSFGQLAAAYAGQGDFQKAEPLYRRSLKALEAAEPRDEQLILIARYNLAAMADERRRFSDAEVAAAELVEPLTRLLGPGEPATVGCRTMLAEGANRRRDHATAETLAREALAAARTRLGVQHRLTQRAAVALAAALHGLHRDAEAEELLGRVRADIAALAWWRTVDLTPTEQAIAALLEETGRVADSIPIRRKILRDFLARFGADAPATQRAARMLQAALAAGGEEPAVTSGQSQVRGAVGQPARPAPAAR